MSWKNQVVEAESGEHYRITGRKPRDIPALIAEYVVACECSGLEIGVIDSVPASGPRGADVIRFQSIAFNGVRTESRSLAEAAGEIIKDFEAGSTEAVFVLFD